MHNVIIGGGWAGLAAGVLLAQKGQQVSLLEASPHLGGRARSFNHTFGTVDNGQHLFMGAYQHVFDLLNIIHPHPAKQLFESDGFHYPQFNTHASILFADPRSKWRSLLALLKSKGYSIAAKYSLIRIIHQLEKINFKLDKDERLSDWLLKHRAHPQLMQTLFEPLCLAALTTPCDQASSQIFFNVLKKALFSDQHAARLMLARKPLSELLAEPARQYITAHQGRVFTGERVNKLVIDNHQIKAVITAKRTLKADRVICATSCFHTHPLFTPHALLAPLSQQLQTFQPNAISTLYLKYPGVYQLPHLMQGLLNGPGQFAFIHRQNPQYTVVSVVISGPVSSYSKATLKTAIINQLTTLNPVFAKPVDHLLIQEKNSAFLATPNQQRPSITTPIKDLYCIGDYVDTGLPTCLEGAVLSANKLAEVI